MPTQLTRNLRPARWSDRGASLTASIPGAHARAATVKRLLALTLVVACFPLAADATTLYDTIPSPLPPNVPSLGYQATQTSEFGDLIQFASTDRPLGHVTLVMSDWALASDYPMFPGSAGPTWDHPLTLNLYNVDNSGANPAPGTLIATRTQTVAIPWRPPADLTCPGGTAWRASDGNCYNGLAFTVTFDFTGTSVPSQVIYGVAFNTQTWGYSPIGTPGPYVSLNFGLTDQAPTVGTDPFPDTAYWNTQTAGNYGDGGAGGVGIFRRDTGWTPYRGAIVVRVAGIDRGSHTLAARSLVARRHPGPVCDHDVASKRREIRRMKSGRHFLPGRLGCKLICRADSWGSGDWSDRTSALRGPWDRAGTR